MSDTRTQGQGGEDLELDFADIFGSGSTPEVGGAGEKRFEERGLEEIIARVGLPQDQPAGDVDPGLRYELALAFKEAGLLDEAIHELMLAARGRGRVFECARMLGLCFMQKGVPEQAAKCFERALAEPARRAEEYATVWCDLAIAEEPIGTCFYSPDGDAAMGSLRRRCRERG